MALSRFAATPALHSGWVLALGVAMVVLAHFHVLPPLIHTWLDSPEFSHGLLIPLVVGYIVWDTRDRIFASLFGPSWLGVGLLVFAQLLLFAAVLADLEKIKAYAMLLSLVALLIAVAGPRITRRCFFPLLLLALSIPLPYLVTKLLTAELQFISTDLGVVMLRLLGIPVLQEGNIINMGHFKLLVEEACSGLRYMFPLISVGLVLAYFFRAPVWAKISVVVVTVPITILMNSFRIAATGIIIGRFGSEAAAGFLHAFEGWVVFVLALLFLLIYVWGINRLLPGKRRLAQSFQIRALDTRIHFERWRSLPAPVLAFFAILSAGAIGSAYMSFGLTPMHLQREPFDRLPYVIDGRALQRKELDPSVINVLKSDDYFVGDYTEKGSVPVNLYMAYYAVQRDGAVVHSPRDCLPAGGWRIESIEQIDLPGLGGRGNRVIISKAGERLLVYYWVHQQGRNYANELQARAALLMQSVLHRRTDASLVRVTVPIAGSIEASEKALIGFVDAFAPDLPRFLPL